MSRFGFIVVLVLALVLGGSVCVLGSLQTTALVSFHENLALIGATYDVLQDRPDLLEQIGMRFRDIAEWGDKEIKAITSAAEQELVLYGDIKRVVKITEVHQEMKSRLNDAINDVVKDPRVKERIQTEANQLNRWNGR